MMCVAQGVNPVEGHRQNHNTDLFRLSLWICSRTHIHMQKVHLCVGIKTRLFNRHCYRELCPGQLLSRGLYIM